jgi:glucose-6-phosphate 1-epimerase
VTGRPAAETSSLDALQARLGGDGSVRVGVGLGALTRLHVTTPWAEAELYLHGAHVTHYQPRGQAPVLFLSARSRFEAGVPIRGGVPICFPWFGSRPGDPGAGLHGVARLAEWEVLDAVPAADGAVAVTLRLRPPATAPAGWPAAAHLTYRVTVGPTLGLALHIENRAATRLSVEAALHPYFAVSDVGQVSVGGLQGAPFLDTTREADRGGGRGIQGAAALRFTGETDLIYTETRGPYAIDDPGGGRRLTISKTGSDVTVVWNPWATRARTLPDLGDDEWPAMLCVEPAQTGHAPIRLEPGGHHVLATEIRSEPR